MAFGFLLLTLVGLISSAQSLQCKACESNISWDDCQSKIFLEDCGLIINPNKPKHVHQCFQLEENDPTTKKILYRQGCTGDVAFCSERPKENMQQCSLCTDDSVSSECTSMVHRVKKTSDGKLVDVVDTIHFQRTEAKANPSEPVNSSTVIDFASKKNGSDEANTLKVEMKNGQTSEKDETGVQVTNQTEGALSSTEPPKIVTLNTASITPPKSACNRNVKTPATSTEKDQGIYTIQPDGGNATETSTSSSVDPQGPIIATGPPEVKSSRSFGLANCAAPIWVFGLLVVINFLNVDM